MRRLTAFLVVFLAACSPRVDATDAAAATGGGAGGAGASGVGGAGAGASGGGGAAPCVPSGDHASDPKNCGACGHDCLGGACTAGQCRPVAIWTGRADPPLYVDAEYVYWALYKPTGEHECRKASLVRAPKSSPPLTGAPEVIAAESKLLGGPRWRCRHQRRLSVLRRSRLSRVGVHSAIPGQCVGPSRNDDRHR